jgi:hypothetical protein
MPVWFSCVVLLGYFPCKVIILIQISATPSDMGEACLLLSFCRNAIPLCSHESFGYVNYDYLVVEKLMILKMVN